MQTSRGFTIIELIVVILVLGILVTITALGLVRYQLDARDTQRSTNVSIIAEALEKYYNEKGEYPSCSVLTGSVGTLTGNSGIFPGMSTSVFRAPGAANGVTNSIQCTDLISVTSADYYAYVGDSGSCTGTTTCLKYVLKYKEEATNTIQSLSSRR